ncbi:MAG: hypothetical protein EWV76_17305 [Microcystis novacekii Mn_MB_F_20050700_S1]|uniref:Uncharacterized protein n=1 Tax=Microcystis novacekii Mn_MB_F_20050700_S1D TaxID=2486266 RepID=A0A552J4E2_9CHRO|nr:MAG: hypothetical protein EWV76_17305 [Microcystis novacekii Mn_MB_F_20050700_S1]TRU90636.1 MAG: hypothetical protein EWV54_06425 [Microcystis novacekii Mn_MB_F_20050700_S1D]
MNTTTNQSINPNLADAALSLQTVRNYRRDRPVYGKKRVNLYFEDNLGDWLNQAVIFRVNQFLSFNQRQLCPYI